MKIDKHFKDVKNNLNGVKLTSKYVLYGIISK